MKYANSLKRLLAFLIDSIFLFFLDLVVGMFVNPQGGKVVATAGLSFDISSPEKAITTLVNISYFVILTALWGATLGKRLLGMQVVDSQRKTPSFGKVLLRETIGKLISFLVLGIGFIWIIFDGKKQGWHDKIAGTYVIAK